MLNKACLLGNVGKDPEIRRMQDGRPIANFSLATTERWNDKTTGEKREKVEWHKVVVFSEGLAKVVENYVKKGSKLYVEGKIQTRKWQDQTGQDRYSTEIVLTGFDGKIVLLDRRQETQSQDSHGTQEAASPRPSTREELNDEIPF